MEIKVESSHGLVSLVIRQHGRDEQSRAVYHETHMLLPPYQAFSLATRLLETGDQAIAQRTEPVVHTRSDAVETDVPIGEDPRWPDT